MSEHTVSWTQPFCDGCWRLFNPDRRPLRLKGETERCCVCGLFTQSGIYVRIDPRTVLYPSDVE